MSLVEDIQHLIAATIGPAPEAHILLVVDRACPLAIQLGDAYKAALPQAHAMLFEALDPLPVLQAMQKLTKGDVAILVQSTSFRLNTFRFRLELFKELQEAVVVMLQLVNSILSEFYNGPLFTVEIKRIAPLGLTEELQQTT